MESDTPRTDDEFADAIKQLDLRAELAAAKAELAAMREQRDEAVDLYRDLLIRATGVKRGGGA